MTDQIGHLREDVANLQAQLAFQEDAIASLDATVAAQQQDILLLKRQIALLHERQAQYSEQPAGDALSSLEEKPPHY